MFFERKSTAKWMICIGAAMVAVGALLTWMMGSRKGRRITRRARHIGRQVENLIKKEMA